MVEQKATKKRILVLGGGFAGVYAASRLEKHLARLPDVELMLVAKENFVLFTPMLHEVAGSDVGAADVVQPLRKMLRHTRVVIAEIEAIDLARKTVHIVHRGLGQAFDLTYEQLVLALGSITNFYRTPGIEEHALTMKTLGDAIVLRNRVIAALDLADNHPDETERKRILTILVTGGGFAGVETVGAVNDLLRESLKFYRNLKPDMLRVVLVQGGGAILPELGERLGRYAQKKLEERGVEVRLKIAVAGYDGREVVLSDGARIATHLVVWTAGVTPPPLLSGLSCTVQHGHLVADEYLRVPGWPGVWALGDCASVPDFYNPGKFCPPTAQHATRQAAALASNIVAEIKGRTLRPFKFKTLGLLATIGRRTGVAEILGMRFSGLIAWLLWRTIYLSKLPGTQKKVRVALDWTLDLFFSKDIVELPTLRAPTMSVAEEPTAPVLHEHDLEHIER
jgi:NADH dehydrogenase